MLSCSEFSFHFTNIYACSVYSNRNNFQSLSCADIQADLDLHCTNILEGIFHIQHLMNVRQKVNYQGYKLDAGTDYTGSPHSPFKIFIPSQPISQQNANSESTDQTAQNIKSESMPGLSGLQLRVRDKNLLF